MSLDSFNTPTEQLRLHRQDLPEPADDPLVGRLLDSKYELVARLGEGGMGAVYRARRLHIGDEVAVKILLKQYVASAEAIERFRREARAAALLRHPNVVAIYDFGEARGEDALCWNSLRRILCRGMEVTVEELRLPLYINSTARFVLAAPSLSCASLRLLALFALPHRKCDN